jgi:hypothetical protein
MVSLELAVIASACRLAKIGGDLFRYLLHGADGDDLGEATYAKMIKAGEEILVGNGRRLRVLDVVPFDDGETPFVGMLRVEAA